MNDSSQKLPGWLSDDLRPFVYECGLEDKVMELDKSFARENILNTGQMKGNHVTVCHEISVRFQ